MRMSHAGRVTLLLLPVVLTLSLWPALSQAEAPVAPTTVVAKEFQLVDDHGTPRAILGVCDGSVGLFLLAKTGTTRLNLVVLQDESPALLLHDANGIIRAKLVDIVDDTPALALHDREGHDRLVLSLLPDGRAAVLLLDRDGTIQAQLWINEEGVSRLDLATAQRSREQVRAPDAYRRSVCKVPLVMQTARNKVWLPDALASVTRCRRP